MEHVEQFTTHSALDKVFLEGNALFLTRHFQQLIEAQNIRVAVFSDKYLDDIVAIKKFNKTLEDSHSDARWHAFAIIEELCYFPEIVKKGYKPSLVPNYS